MKSTLAELKSPRELLGRLSRIPCMPIRVWPSFKSVEFSNKALYQEGVVGDAQTRQRLTILYCPHCTSLCYIYIVRIARRFAIPISSALHVALLYPYVCIARRFAIRLSMFNNLLSIFYTWSKCSPATWSCLRRCSQHSGVRSRSQPPGPQRYALCTSARLKFIVVS